MQQDPEKEEKLEGVFVRKKNKIEKGLKIIFSVIFRERQWNQV